jgi:tetratricopeptide (TPR) repeat protein
MNAHPQEQAGRTADQVLLAFGERFESLFEQRLGSGAPNAQDRAVEAGRRALGYCIRAGALERLHVFTSTLILNTRDPRLLDGLVGPSGLLRALIEQVPEGQPRWRLRTYIADGLRMAGRTDKSLPFYAQAAAEAESAGDWSDLGAITQNQANALGDAGQLEAAKVQYRASAEAKRKAGSPEIDVLMSEMESLRIDVKQGGAAAARPAIEQRHARVRGWWRQVRAGGTVPEAPDPEALGRTMAGALDIAREAALSLEDWEGTLALLDELESVQQASGTGEHERARTRFNRYGPLLRLRRLSEAQSVLESCLEVFRRCDDITAQATTFSALADLWDEKGDPGQAADLARRALDLCNRLPDPGDRGLSHNNLANYLHRLGEGADAAPHRLAALCYALIGGYGDDLRQWLHNLSIVMAESRAQGQTDPLPTLERLLADPRFDALRRFVAGRGIDPADLQRALDDLIAQAGG